MKKTKTNYKWLSLAISGLLCSSAYAQNNSYNDELRHEALLEERFNAIANQVLPVSKRKAAGLIVKYRMPQQAGIMNARQKQSFFANKSSQRAMTDLSAKLGAKSKHKRFTALESQVIEFDAGLKTVAELEQLASILRQDPNIEYVNINRIMYPLLTPNDPRYNEQWHYNGAQGINLEAAWDITQGDGINVAVLDTGYTRHADLAANIVGGYDFVSDATSARDGNGRDNDARDEGDWNPTQRPGCPVSDSSWHGTHVAGTIAAVTNNNQGVAGVAYGARVVPLRVLAHCGGTTADIADAIIWASGGNVNGVPANPNVAKVINMSLGGGGACDNTSQNAINTARNNGSVVVAAGNDNENVSGSNPANCDGVIAVAATDNAGSRAGYSNYGNLIDIAAPGGTRGALILSTVDSGRQRPEGDTYVGNGGTSMAAPHVAGVAALMFAVNNNLTPDEVEQHIKDSARAYPNGSTCNNNNCGAGILDAAAAVRAAQGNGGGGNPPPADDNTLEKVVAKTNIIGDSGSSKRYTFEVPANAKNLNIDISGFTGDPDLYVKFGSEPKKADQANGQCRPWECSGKAESCSYASPQEGTYHIMIDGYSNYSNLSLKADYEVDGGNNPPPAGGEFTNSNNVDINDKQTSESNITVSNRNRIGNVDIKVDIKHSYIEDLKVTLVAPDNSEKVLHNHTGGSADNINQTYSYDLSSVANNGNGTWKLRVYDRANQDTGYIDSWSIVFK